MQSINFTARNKIKFSIITNTASKKLKEKKGNQAFKLIIAIQLTKAPTVVESKVSHDKQLLKQLINHI